MNTTPTLDLRNHGGAHSLLNCHVFAKPENLAVLESAGAERRTAALTLSPIAGNDPLPADAVRHADCIVLEVDPSDKASLARIDQVRLAKPAMPIIAAIQNADFNLTRLLVRQGVFDIVELPFDAEELMSRIMDAGATLAARTNVRLAPMVAVVGGSAAIGATTVITHLAAALSQAAGSHRRCCVVDLDLQFGQVASYFGIEPSVSVLELLEAGNRLDSELVRNAALDSGHGPVVLAAPTTIAPLELVDVDRLLRLLEIVRQEYDFVLLDLPSSWTNWTLSAVLASSEVLLVTDQSIRSLRQAKRCIELFDSVEMPTASISVLVNSFEKRMLQRIDVREIESALNRRVRASFAREKAGMDQAQDQGLLLHQVVRKPKFSQDVAAFAEELVGSVHS